MKKFFKEFDSHQIKILYKTSNQDFERGYYRFKELHNDNNLIFQKEKDIPLSFKESLLHLFNSSFRHTIFFVDDNVFKEPFSVEDDEFKYFSSHEDVATLSLRLHPRLTYCYPARINMTPPNFGEYNTFLWLGQSGDYGYPMSLDGHVFRSSDIYYYIIAGNYNGPNPLEAQMAVNPIPFKKMMCYDKSIILNNPLNKVQNYNNNIHGNVTAEFLNKEFLSGKIIDLSTFEGIDNKSCHQEIQVNLFNFIF